MKQHLLFEEQPVDDVVRDFKVLREKYGGRTEDLLSQLAAMYHQTGVGHYVPIIQRWFRHIERAEATTWVAVVTDQQSDEEVARYPLRRHDPTDERHWAERYAEDCGLEIDESDGYIPNCGGDFEVAIYDTATMTVPGIHRWSSECFYFKREE